jgi:hypothetical protein
MRENSARKERIICFQFQAPSSAKTLKSDPQKNRLVEELRRSWSLDGRLFFDEIGSFIHEKVGNSILITFYPLALR